jgi:hypothetical protein
MEFSSMLRRVALVRRATLRNIPEDSIVHHIHGVRRIVMYQAVVWIIKRGCQIAYFIQLFPYNNGNSLESICITSFN